MPPQIQADQDSGSAPDSERSSRVSRRSLLRGAGVVGVAGIAAASGVGAAVGLARPQTVQRPASKPVAMAPVPPNAMAGPLVVYLADTTTGVIDVFAGTGQTRLRNPALVGQLLQNLQMAQ